MCIYLVFISHNHTHKQIMSKMLERLNNSYLFNDPIVGTARRIVDPSGAQTVRRRGSEELSSRLAAPLCFLNLIS